MRHGRRYHFIRKAGGDAINMATETIKITTRSVIDLYTQEEHGTDPTPGLPYRANRYRSDSVPGGIYPWHWHAEAECFTVQEGALRYVLQGAEMEFRPGDAGFLNAGVLHMTRQAGDAPCVQQNHIFLPEFLCADRRSPIWQRYIEPLTGNQAARLLRLEADSQEAAEVRRWMEAARQAREAADFGYELVLRDCMTRIWLIFLRAMPEPQSAEDPADSLRLMQMLDYIRQNLSQRITLKDLADAAHISTRECERCFQRQIGTLPFDYLMDTRLDRARRMLLEGDRPVTEIALQCGFSSGSYFTLCFRRKYGLAPSAYRKK